MKPLLGRCQLVVVVLCTLAIRIGRAAVIDNVDRLEPVVRSSPDTVNVGDEFGFSVVLHQLVSNPGNRLEALEQTRIIIGAPKGTFPGGLTNLVDYFEPAVNLTGLVYSCPLTTSECLGVTGDTSVYSTDSAIADNNGMTLSPPLLRLPDSFTEGRLFDQAPDAILSRTPTSLNQFIAYENKTGQLLGATLYSDGDNFIACAPRWTSTNNNAFNPAAPDNAYEQQARGICYASDRSLTGFRALRACIDINSGTSTNNGVQGGTGGQGYCLQGTSVTVASGQYVVSTPGFLLNRGAIATAPINDVRPVPFNMRTETQNQINPDDPSGPLIPINDQYTGFRIVKAFVTLQRGSGAADIIATVPRYDRNTNRGRINVFRQNNFNNIDRNLFGEGTQMGEFFGYSIAVVDLDGDMYDDVIVGAPMYTNFDSSLTEVGRVYVFYNNDGASLSEPVVLEGQQAGGRFGTSVVNLGDIDNDGYEDFAVGAPYSRHGDIDSNGNTDTTGSVFIYYGDPNMTALGIRPPVEISAVDITNNVVGLDRLETFGFSLASGVDVDRNQYNDLAIGAYQSQTVVLLRTLPVADVEITLTRDVAPINIDLDSSFEVTVSGMYSGRGLTGARSVDFKLTEVLDASSDNRLFFEENNENADSVTGTLSFPGPNSSVSKTVTIYVKRDIIVTNLMVSIELLPIARSIDNVVTGSQPVSDFDPFPQIRQLGATAISVNVTDPCQNDGCMSRLSFTSALPNPITIQAGNEVSPRVTLTYVNANGSEDAFSTRLRISNFNRNAFRSVSLVTAQTGAQCNSTGEVIICNLRDRIRPNGESLNSELTFNLREGGLQGNEGSFSINLEILTRNDTDDFDDPSDNTVVLTFNVMAIADINVFSSLPDVLEYTSEELTGVTMASDLGQPVRLIINIGNGGPTTIQNADLQILVPSRDADVTGGNFFLYITEIVTRGNTTCSMDAVDPMNLVTSQSGGRKRSLDASPSSWKKEKKEAYRALTRRRRQTTDGSTSGVASTVIFSCADPARSGQCTQINCNLRDLTAGTNVAGVTISTRVDGRFFGQLGNSRIFNLTAYSNTTIRDIFFDSSTSNITASASSTISLRPMVEMVPEEDDTSNLIHVIIWPTVGALIIIAVIAVLLYFFGFFRRKKPQDAEGDFEMESQKPPVEGVSYKPEEGVNMGPN